jgi:hypothetical protein
MHIHTYSKTSKEGLILFNKIFSNNYIPFHKALFKKIIRCDCNLMIIDLNELEIDKNISSQEVQVIKTLSKIWKDCQIVADAGNPYYNKNSREILDIVDLLFFDRSMESINIGLMLTQSRLVQLNSEGLDKWFVIFNKDYERYGLPSFQLSLLTNIYQLELGNLPLHAACIIKNSKSFLFAGPSGHGKSTISKISKDLGYRVIDQDQVLVYQIDDGKYYVDAWGYDVKSHDEPLTAIYFLHQSSENRIIPISTPKSTIKIFERFVDITMKNLNNEILSQSFNLSALIARNVPCFDLYFQKSPDFWKLIDTEFGLE